MREVIDNGSMPKNMRQIGEPGTGIRILVEDYAYTYLCQLARENLTGMSTVILLGKIREDQAVCVQGAMELDMGQELEQWFSGESWRAIFERIKTWFEDLEIVGWGLLNPGFPPALTERLTAIHNRHFPGKYQVFFQMDILDNEEVFYVREASGLLPRSGYYIYYEKNDAMQAYMSEQRGGAGIEPEGMIRDRAAMRFRSMMQEKKEYHSQRKAMAFLCTACTFLVMVILVIGVTLINNYDRMTQMEHAIYELSENHRRIFRKCQKKQCWQKISRRHRRNSLRNSRKRQWRSIQGILFQRNLCRKRYLTRWKQRRKNRSSRNSMRYSREIPFWKSAEESMGQIKW